VTEPLSSVKAMLVKTPDTSEQELKDLLYRERVLIYNLVYNLHQEYPLMGYGEIARRILELSNQAGSFGPTRIALSNLENIMSESERIGNMAEVLWKKLSGKKDGLT